MCIEDTLQCRFNKSSLLAWNFAGVELEYANRTQAAIARSMPEAMLPTAIALLAKLLIISADAAENPNTPASSLDNFSQ